MNKTEIEAYTVPHTASIEAALAVIEANHHRCAIVIDEASRVIGTVSDGDIRRAMLNHRLLSAPVDAVMNLNFVSLAPGDISKAGELSKKMHVHVFPVVGPGNELVDVVTVY